LLLFLPPLRYSRLSSGKPLAMDARVSPPPSVSVGGGFGGARGDDSAFSFLSKGWREVRDSATADLRLMRARADSLRTLADRELEQLLASASTALAPPPPLAAGAPIAELEFVRTRIQPKISELRRRYASQERDLGRRVLEGWAPRGAGGPARARVDLSGITAIRNALVSEAGGGERWRRAAWKEGDAEAEEGKEWEVVRMIRDGIKEFERRSQTSEIFEGLRNTGELVEKFKSSLVISS
jgi:digalactosyldiacylglycerol synthase